MVESGMANSLLLLRSDGDAVEKFACDEASIAPLIGQYAAIWANYVRPKRMPGNPALIEGPIADLAERHYTALVRLLGALGAAKRASDACIELASGATAGSSVVVVQSELLTFFSSAGAAVENLEAAYAAPPIGSKSALMPNPSDVFGSPKWFYDRRTQYVHKRLLPIFEIDGVLHIDTEHFFDKEVKWNDSTHKVHELSASVENLASLLVAGLVTGWSQLYKRLRSAAPVAVGPSGSPMPITITSGSPRNR
jgi:hypothetical protein